MTIPRAPYVFAARAAGFVALFVAALFAADAGITALARRGVRVIPKLPPAEVTNLFAADGAVLVLGDSVMTYLPKGDRDRTLVDAIAASLPVRVVDGSKRGRGAAFLAGSIDTILRCGVRPAAVIVELNPANYCTEWEENPGMQEPDMVLTLTTGFALPVRAASVFKYEFGAPTDEQYLAAPIWMNGAVAGTIGDFVHPQPPYKSDEGARADIVRTRAISRYAGDIARSRTFPLLAPAFAKLRAAGIPCVAFVTPIDAEHVRSVLGEGDFAAVERNVAALRGAAEAAGVRCLDLSSALPQASFVHPAAFHDEHLTSAAREVVASKVAELARGALVPR